MILFRFFVLLAALWSPFFASASIVVNNGAVGVSANGSNYVVEDGNGGLAYGGRTWQNPSSRGGAVTLSENYTGRIAGGAIAVVARRAIPAASAISAAKESFIIGCQAGTELSAYLGLGTPSSSRTGCNVTDWLFDDGQEPTGGSTVTQNQVRFGYNGTVGPWDVDPRIACEFAPAYGTYWNTPVWNAANNSCRAYNKTSPSSYINYAAVYRTVDVVTPSSCPAYIDALDPAYSGAAGSPPGPDGKCPTGRYNKIDAATARAKMDAYADYSKASDVLNKILESGGVISVNGERSLSGTDSVVGTPSTTTTTNPDGSVTTTTTTPNIGYTYNGNTITVTNNTTTTTTTCTGAGSCSTTTTDTQNDDAGTPTDTGMPSVPKLYEQKYPNGVKGVWDSYSSQISQIPLISWLKSLSPSFGDGGCPVWTLPVHVLGINTTGDVSIPCWVWGALKLIFNISALLLARRLIFGG